MREWYRDIMFFLAVAFGAVQAWFAWLGPVPADSSTAQAMANHPVGGLIVFAVLFVAAGLLNSAPLLSRLLPKKKVYAPPIDQADNRKEKFPPLPPPDTSLRDWDPQVHLELTEDPNYGGRNPAERIWFTPVNRGRGDAKIVRLDDFRLPSGWTITCSRSEYRIAPQGQGELTFKIRKPDDALEVQSDLFDILSQQHALLKSNPRDFRLPLRLSYQDEIGNLFLTACDLVFDPRIYLNKGGTPARVENQKFQRIAFATSLLEGVKFKPTP